MNGILFFILLALFSGGISRSIVHLIGYGQLNKKNQKLRELWLKEFDKYEEQKRRRIIENEMDNVWELNWDRFR